MSGPGPFHVVLPDLVSSGYEYRAIAVYQGETITGEIRRFEIRNPRDRRAD